MADSIVYSSVFGAVLASLAPLETSPVAEQKIEAAEQKIDPYNVSGGVDEAVDPAVPGRDVVDAPALLHWAGRTKPWSAEVAPEQDRWFAASARAAMSA